MNNKRAQQVGYWQKGEQMMLCRVPFVATICPPIRKGRLPTCSPSRANSGFTLIELMTVLTVAAILAFIAVPAMGTFIRNARIVAQTNDFLADLAYARSEAIKRHASVAICKSSDTTTASPPTCDAAGDNWGTGRLVFVDADSDGVRDTDDEILRVRDPLEGGNTLNGGANVAASIVFKGTGITTLGAPANPGDNAFALCDEGDTKRGRAIDINVAGRPTLSKNPPSCNPPWP